MLDKKNAKQSIFETAESIHRQKNNKSVKQVITHSSKSEMELIHDLEVHQIELELQNEELRNMHLELEEKEKRYFDLYNLAPLIYVSLDIQGLIQEEILLHQSNLEFKDKNSSINLYPLLYIVKTKISIICLKKSFYNQKSKKFVSYA